MKLLTMFLSASSLPRLVRSSNYELCLVGTESTFEDIIRNAPGLHSIDRIYFESLERCHEWIIENASGEEAKPIAIIQSSLWNACLEHALWHHIIAFHSSLISTILEEKQFIYWNGSSLQSTALSDYDCYLVGNDDDRSSTNSVESIVLRSNGKITLEIATSDFLLASQGRTRRKSKIVRQVLSRLLDGIPWRGVSFIEKLRNTFSSNQAQLTLEAGPLPIFQPFNFFEFLSMDDEVKLAIRDGGGVLRRSAGSGMIFVYTTHPDNISSIEKSICRNTDGIFVHKSWVLECVRRGELVPFDGHECSVLPSRPPFHTQFLCRSYNVYLDESLQQMLTARDSEILKHFQNGFGVRFVDLPKDADFEIVPPILDMRVCESDLQGRNRHTFFCVKSYVVNGPHSVCSYSHRPIFRSQLNRNALEGKSVYYASTPEIAIATSGADELDALGRRTFVQFVVEQFGGRVMSSVEELMRANEPLILTDGEIPPGRNYLAEAVVNFGSHQVAEYFETLCAAAAPALSHSSVSTSTPFHSVAGEGDTQGSSSNYSDQTHQTPQYISTCSDPGSCYLPLPRTPQSASRGACESVRNDGEKFLFARRTASSWIHTFFAAHGFIETDVSNDQTEQSQEPDDDEEALPTHESILKIFSDAPSGAATANEPFRYTTFSASIIGEFHLAGMTANLVMRKLVGYLVELLKKLGVKVTVGELENTHTNILSGTALFLGDVYSDNGSVVSIAEFILTSSSSLEAVAAAAAAVNESDHVVGTVSILWERILRFVCNMRPLPSTLTDVHVSVLCTRRDVSSFESVNASLGNLTGPDFSSRGVKVVVNICSEDEIRRHLQQGDSQFDQNIPIKIYIIDPRTNIIVQVPALKKVEHVNRITFPQVKELLAKVDEHLLATNKMKVDFCASCTSERLGEGLIYPGYRVRALECSSCGRGAEGGGGHVIIREKRKFDHDMIPESGVQNISSSSPDPCNSAQATNITDHVSFDRLVEENLQLALARYFRLKQKYRMATDPPGLSNELKRQKMIMLEKVRERIFRLDKDNATWLVVWYNMRECMMVVCRETGQFRYICSEDCCLCSTGPDFDMYCSRHKHCGAVLVEGDAQEIETNNNNNSNLVF